MRALTTASMDTPGPYEKIAKEAFFNVTLPERSWTPQQVEEHMEGFNRGTIISTAIHEAYPGHYVQFLWMQTIPSKVRKLLGANSNAEGWAHYCEQMMLDEGYGNGDLKLRLGQLQDALLRDARYIVGIEMHTGKMTYEQGIDFFVHEGYQTRINGERETKRGTSNPTYLYYTLGKLEILKLREDYKKMRGEQPYAAGISRSVHAAGDAADQDRAEGAVGERFAGVITRNVGRTPSSAPDPWSGSANARELKADAGVGRWLIEKPWGTAPPSGTVQSIEARQQLQIFLGYGFQRISGAAPGPQSTGYHVRIEPFFAQ